MTRVEQYKAKVLPSVVNFVLNCSHALIKPSLCKHFFLMCRVWSHVIILKMLAQPELEWNRIILISIKKNKPTHSNSCTEGQF